MLQCKELQNPMKCFQEQRETRTTKRFHLQEARPLFKGKKFTNQLVLQPVKQKIIPTILKEILYLFLIIEDGAMLVSSVLGPFS